jgi:glutathione S-transferase
MSARRPALSTEIAQEAAAKLPRGVHRKPPSATGRLDRPATGCCSRGTIAHKGVPVEYRWVRFADVETIRALSGKDKVPILMDGDHIIHDSWNIVVHLETRFPDHPSLFGGEVGRGLARYVNLWSDTTLGPAIRRLISADFIYCLAPEDRAYFRRSREAQFGCSLEEYCADRDWWLDEFEAVITPLERTLSEQDYVAGGNPSYADYLLLSVFEYARLGSPLENLGPETALRRWRDRLVARFDHLGDRFPAYPARRDGPDGR